MEDIIDQDRACLAVERDRICIIAPPEHLCLRYAGHLLHRAVPGDDAAVRIDDEGCIGEKIDDIGKLRLALLDPALAPGKVVEACPELLLDGGKLLVRRPQFLVPLQQFEFGEFTLGDIVRHPDREGGLPQCVPQVFAPFSDIPDLPGVGTKYPVFDGIGGLSFRDRGRVGCMDHGPVVRVHHREERLVGHHTLPGIEAEYAVGLVRPRQPPGPVIEHPAPEMRKALGLMQHLLAPANRDLRLLLPGQLPDSVCKLGKLRLRIAPLLEVEVGAVVQRLDHHLFASLAGEYDEGHLRSGLPDPLQESDTVHLRHLVVRDDHVIPAGHDQRIRFKRVCRDIDGYIARSLKVEAGDIEQHGLVVDIECLNGG